MTARPRDHVVPSGLPALAEAVARWVDDISEVPAVYVFGSRVRGDHRPSSEVDLCLFFDEWADGDPVAADDWWSRQNGEDFAAFKATLPGRLQLHPDLDDPALGWVREARADPARLVLRVHKAVCLWTCPKPSRSANNMTTL